MKAQRWRDSEPYRMIIKDEAPDHVYVTLALRALFGPLDQRAEAHERCRWLAYKWWFALYLGA